MCMCIAATVSSCDVGFGCLFAFICVFLFHFLQRIGFEMGVATSGGTIQVQTSMDTAPSDSVSSGAIFGQVASVSFNIISSDRVAQKSMATVTIGFTPTTSVPIGGTLIGIPHAPPILSKPLAHCCIHLTSGA